MKCNQFSKKARNKVTIQQRSVSGDDYGGSSGTWSTLSTEWAIIEPSSGREVFETAQLQSRVTSKITIRYNSSLKDTAVTGKYRISFDGRIYQIRYVQNLHEDMKREGAAFQKLFCEENDAGNG